MSTKSRNRLSFFPMKSVKRVYRNRRKKKIFAGPYEIWDIIHLHDQVSFPFFFFFFDSRDRLRRLSTLPCKHSILNEEF